MYHKQQHLSWLVNKTQSFQEQKMDGDNYDSFDDEKFTADEILEERYSRRKKMKEYLQKWRGYSSMNNGSKLEADLVAFSFNFKYP